MAKKKTAKKPAAKAEEPKADKPAEPKLEPTLTPAEWAELQDLARKREAAKSRGSAANAEAKGYGDQISTILLAGQYDADRPIIVAEQAAEDKAADAKLRGVKLSGSEWDLPAHIMAKLMAEPDPITTYGHLCDYVDKQDLTDIDGIGKKAVEQIKVAETKFLAEHAEMKEAAAKPAAPASPGEDASLSGLLPDDLVEWFAEAGIHNLGELRAFPPGNWARFSDDQKALIDELLQQKAVGDSRQPAAVNDLSAKITKADLPERLVEWFAKKGVITVAQLREIPVARYQNFIEDDKRAIAALLQKAAGDSVRAADAACDAADDARHPSDLLTDTGLPAGILKHLKAAGHTTVSGLKTWYHRGGKLLDIPGIGAGSLVQVGLVVDPENYKKPA